MFHFRPARRNFASDKREVENLGNIYFFFSHIRLPLAAIFFFFFFNVIDTLRKLFSLYASTTSPGTSRERDRCSQKAKQINKI